MIGRTIFIGAIVVLGIISLVATCSLYADLYKKLITKIYPEESERRDIDDEIITFFLSLIVFIEVVIFLVVIFLIAAK